MILGGNHPSKPLTFAWHSYFFTYLMYTKSLFPTIGSNILRGAPREPCTWKVHVGTAPPNLEELAYADRARLAVDPLVRLAEFVLTVSHTRPLDYCR